LKTKKGFNNKDEEKNNRKIYPEINQPVDFILNGFYF
jgi:hypothetical protein